MDVEASLKIEKKKENIGWQTFKNQFFNSIKKLNYN